METLCDDYDETIDYLAVAVVAVGLVVAVIVVVVVVVVVVEGRRLRRHSQGLTQGGMSTMK